MGRAAAIAAAAAAVALGSAEARQLHQQVALTAGVTRELATQLGELNGRNMQGIEDITNAIFSCMDAYNIGAHMRCLNKAVVDGTGVEPIASVTDSENNSTSSEPSEESMSQMVPENAVEALEALAVANNTATVEQCELAFTPLLPRCMFHIGTDTGFEQNLVNFMTGLTTGFPDADARCDMLKGLVSLVPNATLPGSPDELCEMASDNGGEGELIEGDVAKRDGEGAEEGDNDDDVMKTLTDVVLAGTACNQVDPGITDVQDESTSSPTSAPTVNSASIAQTGFLALFAGVVAAFV